MREIKFKGRAKEPIPNKWFYGGYVRKGKKRTKHYIVNWDEKNTKLVQVDPKSIGQYTGLVDKNGTEIYEGDILTGFVFKERWTGNVKYLAPYFAVLGERSHVILEDLEECRIIGNIYENPELLEE